MSGRWSGARARELSTGWKTLLGAALGSTIGVHALPFYTSGLFMVALQADMGWSRSEISLGITLHALGLGLTAPLVGWLCDRYGERRVILPGLAVHGAALVALSQVNTLAAFCALMGGMALLGAGCASLPYARIVNRRFDRSKGTALGLMITGTAACSAMAPIFVQHIILTEGWRTAYLYLAGAVIIVAPPAMMLLRPPAAAAATGSATLSPPMSYGELASDRIFLRLLVAIFLVALAAPGIITHIAMMMGDDGVGLEAAAWLIGLVGITQTVARLGTGMLVDRFFAPRVAATIFCLSATGFILFALFGAPVAVIGAIAAGLAYGAESDLLGYFVGRYYRPEHFGRIFGLLYSVFLAGNALSPLWYGWSFDYFGNYDVALGSAAAALLLSAAAFGGLPTFREDEQVPERDSGPPAGTGAEAVASA